VKELGDKIDAAEKGKVEEAIADLKRSLEGGDVQAIKDKTEALKQASYKIAEEMYKNAQASQGAQGAQGGPGMGGSAGGQPEDNMKNAQDVDYEVVDDDKK